MAASNAIKAIETMLRIQSKRKNKTKHNKTAKETKEFPPLSFDRFIFICSN